jgi:hypothetical protein
VNEIDLRAEALWSLIPISGLCGWLMVVVFRKLSNRAAIRSAINRLWAHMLEFSLFFDDPIVVLRAQRDLLAANGHLLKLITLPSLVLAALFLVVLSQLEALYGRAPLPLNEPAIVTVHFRPTSFDQLSRYALESPKGTTLETPGVRAESVSEISWRVRPYHASKGILQIVGPGRAVRKTVIAGNGVHYLSRWRESSIFQFLLHPTERPLSDGMIGSIEIRYPPATILHHHWLVWFVVASMIAAGFPSLLRALKMRFVQR